jgi:hypothetical protein
VQPGCGCRFSLDSRVDSTPLPASRVRQILLKDTEITDEVEATGDDTEHNTFVSWYLFRIAHKKHTGYCSLCKQRGVFYLAVPIEASL